MGGLTAALRLAQTGWRVEVLEARASAGGLASGFELEGFPFDGGPYILLDRPGLEWAFRAVGMDLDACLTLKRIGSVYTVETPGGERCTFYSDLGKTADSFEHTWPGSGERYRKFVAQTGAMHERLAPLQHISHPGPGQLLKVGAWRDAPFLLRSLGDNLARTGLPEAVRNAIGIWTHIAGQSLAEAPSPLAFVPSLIHGAGAFYPLEGIGAIPRVLAAAAERAGVAFRYVSRVSAIRSEGGAATGVTLDSGEFLAADVVVSNCSGIATGLELAGDATSTGGRAYLAGLPLQSPGVCAYLAVRGTPQPPYLRFLLPDSGELCRAFIQPGVMDPTLECDAWYPARLMSPMRHGEAERLGPDGQRAYLERILEETWWRKGLDDVRVLAARTPTDWGAEFHLYRNSMNPVMTARFMREGRLPHRSPYLRGLYLAGSSTHPGQWVSFCAISGVLAAQEIANDFPA
jgi:phytoene dehydrogenase-like protein